MPTLRSQQILPVVSTITTPTISGIRGFTKVSKNATAATIGKENITRISTSAGKDDEIAVAKKIPSQVPSTPRKRKLTAPTDENETSKSPRHHTSQATPRTRRTAEQIDNETKTPSKKLAQSLESCQLKTPSKKHEKESRNGNANGKLPVISSPIASPTSDELPQSLLDLIHLHSSFLTAMSVHLAHNGRTAPADVRALLPSIEKIWRKRRVLVRDLQRLLGILDKAVMNGFVFEGQQSPFRLANHGLGRVCVEFQASDLQATVTSAPFDEKVLQAYFAKAIEAAYAKHLLEAKSNEDFDFIVFPIATIHSSKEHLTNLNVGKARLSSLKKTSPVSITQQTIKFSPTSKVNGSSLSRSSSLRERIQQKQALLANAQPQPSKADLLRQAAAQRVDDVLGVLTMLSGSGNQDQPRRSTGLVKSGSKGGVTTSFPVPSLVQMVKDSVRSPISKEEVEVCLELLADAKVAKDWVSFVKVGKSGIRCVVLRGKARLSADVVSERLAILISA